MSEGQNKRKVKKTKNNAIMNIKVSTQDKDILSKDNEINLNIEGTKKAKGKNATLNSTVKKEEKIETRISNLIQQNEKLTKELDQIKSNIKIIEEKEISEIVSLNQEFSTKESEQVKLYKDNQVLLSNLKKIDEEVANRYADKFKISKLISKQKKMANVTNLDTEIKSKEIQAENIQKFINYNKKEVQKLKDLLEQYGENTEEKLSEELNELNAKVNEIQIEIKRLNHIKLQHKHCQKQKYILQSKLNVVSNDLEFESKKSNMIETEKKEPTKIKNVNMSMEYGEKVRNKSLQNAKNKFSNKIKILNYKSYNYLINEFNENRKSKDNLTISYKNEDKSNNLKTSGNIENSALSSYFRDVNHKIDTSTPKKYLFNEKEKEVLKKLIPNEYYNNINEKYKNAENQLTEIEDMFKDNDAIRNQLYYDNVRNEAVNLKLKEQIQIKTNLNIDYNKNHKKMTDLKKKIKELTDSMNIQESLLNKKNKRNKAIKKKIDELKQKGPTHVDAMN
jgi:hypothetical protein